MSNSFEPFVPPAEKEDPRITQAVAWLKEHAKDIKFGNLELSFHFHEGQLRTIDKSLKIRER